MLQKLFPSPGKNYYKEFEAKGGCAALLSCGAHKIEENPHYGGMDDTRTPSLYHS